MALTRTWDEEWSLSEEFGRDLKLVEPVVLPLRTGVTVSRRRAVRERMLRRRRRAVLAVGVIVSVVILAWPGHAFGGETGAGLSVDQANSTVLASGMVYVVQPGNTVNTIARLMNPWNPDVARSALVHELGSDVVVPGEHVLVP